MGKGSGACTGRPSLAMAGSSIINEVEEEFLDAPAEILEDYHKYDLTHNTKKLNYVMVEQNDIKNIIQHLKSEQVSRIALDIETVGDSAWNGAIRVIQIGVEEPEPKQYLIDTWHTDPSEILKVLEDPKKEILTCNGRYEQTWLHYHYNINIENMYDIRLIGEAISKGQGKKRRHRFKDLMRRYLQKQIAKTQQTSDWGQDELSTHQLRYAAMDVAGLLDIRRAMALEEYFYDEEFEGQTKSQDIKSSSLGTMASSAEENQAEYDKIIRALSYAKTLQELEQFEKLLPRMFLSYRQRKKVLQISDKLKANLTE